MRTHNDIEIIEIMERPFGRYLALEPNMPLVLGLWCLATYSFEVFDAFPYLAVTSPTKRCGKTRLAEILQLLAARPRRTVGITPAALFRIIEKEKPTLIVDEAESLSSKSDRAEALREILNAGHRRGQRVLRCVAKPGNDYNTREFETYCPKAFVLIGNLSETLADRCIPIQMRRRRTGEPVDRFLFSRATRETTHTRKLAERWAEQNRERVARYYRRSDLIFLQDREAELWLPLFSVCAICAPSRLGELQAVAERVVGVKQDDELGDLGIRLLGDIREIFGKRQQERVATATLLDELNGVVESPWPTFSRGYSLDARGLSRLLRPFGIQSQNLRFDDIVVKGYAYADFEDALARYLSPLGSPSRYTATECVNRGERGGSVPATCSDRSASKTEDFANAEAACSVVADSVHEQTLVGSENLLSDSRSRPGMSDRDLQADEDLDSLLAELRARGRLGK